MNLPIRLEKKHKYLLRVFLVSIYLYLVAFDVLGLSVLDLSLITLVLVVLSTLFVHYPNIHIKNLPMALIMPLSVLSGAYLTFRYFPNLGLLFKYLIIMIFVFLYYLVTLIDNIFLVVEDRKELIPLYRVAVTWSLVIQSTVAIPLVSGIFKIGINGYIESIIISLISLIFCFYQLWSLKYDNDAKNPRVGEMLYLAFTVFFLVLVSSLAFAFIPTESFLRGLLISSVMMFGLNYVTSHLKNEISKRMLFQYLGIIIIFFIILIIFRP